MKQAVIKKGKVISEEVIFPECFNDGVLVKTIYSAVSVGTELSALKSNVSLLSAIINPRLLKKIIDYTKKHGFGKTKNAVNIKLNLPTGFGYSCVGEVIKVGHNIRDIEVGDFVACGGAGFANHAQVNYVPKNLFVKLPENIDLKQAAYTTISSIALQGVRQADPKIGEYVVVYGLGILGNITLQILKANGINAIGFDVDQTKVDQLSHKNFCVYNSSKINITNIIDKLTFGHGADSIIITASTKDNGKIINEAFDICRKKGTVVLVGVVDLNINRNKMYAKELNFKISTSYGPGRYDPIYEEFGVDYPYGYVRWTENRNMQTVVNLIKSKALDLSDFTKNIFNTNRVTGAFEKLQNRDIDHLLIEYDNINLTDNKTIELGFKSKSGKIKVGIIGPGSFVKSMHIPNIKKLSDFELYGLSDSNPLNAKSVAEQNQFKKIYSNSNELLNDEKIDLVLIGTRHENHGELVLKALKHKKNVFVEKPLCLKKDELEKIKQELIKSRNILMVGHNRSYAPTINQIKTNLIGTKIIQYTVNAGYVPKEHWTQNKQGGGRIIGECVHFFDLCFYLTDSKIRRYSFNKISTTSDKYINDDNFSLNIEFENGDLANIIYTAMGDSNLPKENIKIFNQGDIFEIKDFIEVYDYSKNKTLFKGTQDKGHLEELKVLLDAIKTGNKKEINYRLKNAINATQLALELTK